MQTLARLALLVASLSFALASCAHRSASQSPPADAFFTEPPPEGVLTPVGTGTGDHPPPRRKAPPAESTTPSAVADTAHLVPMKAASPPASSAKAAAAPAAAAPASSAVAAPVAGTSAAAGSAAGTSAAAASAAATSAAAASKVGENVHVDELPVALTRVPPQYPDSARAAGTQGTVQLQALVKTDGTVADVRVTVSVPGLDEAAKACIRQWTFKPGMAGGKPVEAWVGIPVRFAIH